MLIPSNAQNSYLIYSVCRLLLKRNCSNVLNTLFRNKAVVNLATRALVTYIDHLTTITSILENRKAVKKSTFVSFVDFSKVYDTINRKLLWTKLATYGIDGEMFQSLRSIYSNVKCAVKVNHHKTDLFCVKSGSKQYCILSTLLFYLYINDLSDFLSKLYKGILLVDTNINHLCYADDLA